MRAVVVQWNDSIRLANAWDPVDSIDVTATHLRHTTVGFLAKDTPDFIVVCASRMDADEVVGQCVAIPRAAVVSVRDILTASGTLAAEAE